MDVATGLAIANFAVTKGLPAAKSLLETWQKDEITLDDWKSLEEGWEKSPEDYLKEAEKNAGK